MNSHTNRAARSRIFAGLLLPVIACLPFVHNAARADVVFTGLDERQELNVRAFSSLATTRCDSARWRVDRLFRDADKGIRNALQALGYYEAVISKSLRWDEECWHAKFDIQAGEPVRLGKVDIVVDGPAASDDLFLQRVSAERPAAGDTLDHGRYTAFKASIMRAAMHAGYFDADFEHSTVTVDRDKRSADVDMQFHSGPKYRFGSVSFTAGILREELLLGYTDIRPGNPYSARLISELYEALNGSSYFETVSISTEPANPADNTVPVTVSLTPAKRRVYSIGGGYTTDSGLNGRLGYSNRRMNIRGHQFDSRLFLSEVRSELNAAYRWPRNDPRREWYSVTAGIQHQETSTSENDTYKIGVQRTRNLGKDWLETRYIDYALEDFTVADQDTDSQLLMFGSSWETTKGRELGRSAKGYRFSFDLRGASDKLVSDTSFVQLRSTAKWIRSMGANTRVIARAHLGLTAIDDVSTLPASVRFFAGGDQSIRGYEFESLGPVNDDGDVIGGTHLVDASLEFDHRVRDKWAIAAFVDSGSAFNDSDIEFSTGVGVGVRWYSPIGPIRIDFAHPLDDPDKSVRVHIGFGPDL